MLRKFNPQYEKPQDPAGRRRAMARRPFWFGVLLGIVATSMVAGLLFPKNGFAQFGFFVPPPGGFPVADTSSWIQRTIQNIVETARYISDKADKVIDKVSKKVGDVAFKNGLKVFLGKIAEDTATWVASAGTGQKPLFLTDPNYFKDLGNAAAGDYLDSLSKEKFGVSLCDPGAFKITLDIALRVNLNPNFCKEACQQNYADGQNEEQVDVSLNEVDITYPVVTMSLSKAREAVAYLQNPPAGASVDPWKCEDSLTPPEGCLRAYSEAIARAEEKLSAELKQCNSMCAANKRRLASCTLNQIEANAKQGLLASGLTINGQSTNITGATLQQAYETGDLPTIFRPDQNPLGMFLTLSAETQAADAAKKQEEKDILTFNSIFPLRSLISGKVKTPGAVNTEAVNKKLNPDDPTAVQTGSPVADAFGIFTNTLTSKLIERIFKKGIADDKGNANSFTSGVGAISSSSNGVQAARERFASLAQVSFGTGGGIDILNELSACPVDVSVVTQTSLGIVQPNNCVLDPSFRQAIEERLTVKEALKRGLLSERKTFGFDANGIEPDFRNGYPHRSLVVLRKYRIIPVGWELAAQYIRDFESQNVGLNTIVNQFDDPTSAYYRLIDPSWVLKAPENICRRTGFTEAVVLDEFVDADGDEGAQKNIDYQKRYCNSGSDANIGQVCTCGNPAGEVTDDGVTPCVASYPTTAAAAPPKSKCTEDVGTDTEANCAFITPRERQVQRREACVDEQTCILEDDDGTCKQYGTCVEEKDAWRFNGQSCNEQYASCATFTEPAGTQVSYLQNTLQKSVCDPSNAGCQQYCSQYNYTTNTWACTVAASQTKRFDRDLQNCDPAAEGCTQFIRQTTGTNLVRNSGFELGTAFTPAGNTNFDGWNIGGSNQTCGAQGFASTAALSGSQSLRLQALDVCTAADPLNYAYQNIELGTKVADRTFTFSFYAKSEGATCSATSFELHAGTAVAALPVGGYTITPEWQRYVFTHTWGTLNDATSMAIFLRANPTCTLHVDNVQVEEGGSVTDYKDYGAVNLATLKRPPSDLGNDLACTGNTATDPGACSKFIAKCSADDVGCDLFTPVVGGIDIPAKPGQSCPADKVGCATFREQPTIGVLDAHDTRTGSYCANLMDTKMQSCTNDGQCGGVVGSCQPLVSFIGTTGQQCTAQDVGCEAFTNLDEVAKGGEGKAQFTKLQLCVPLAPAYAGAIDNYYAWVGSDESGYQLKKFNLVPSNVNAQAPCTNLGHDLPLFCIDTTIYDPVTNPTGNIIDCQADFGKDPDCSQYYDDGGHITYRLRSRVIEQTADCHPYRNEVDSNIYYADSARSLTCSPAAVGCREYVGNTGSNTRTLLSSDFENGSYAPWVVTGNPSPLSTESVSFGGHSLNVSTAGQADITGLLRQGATYLVSFWAKAEAAPVQLAFGLEATGTVPLGTASVTADWNAYTLGPTTIPFETTGNNFLTVSGGAAYFLDNVVLTELTDSTYKVKASQTVCGGFEGCAAYRNRAGQVVNLMSFAKLCQADKVGCEALINTRNSSIPFAQTLTLPNLRGDVDGSGKIDQADVDALSSFLAQGGVPPFPLAGGDIDADGDVDLTDLSRLTSYVGGDTSAIASAPYPGDTVNTPADVIEYWVNDPAKACNAEDRGCRALGRQQVNLKQSGTSFVPTLLNTETVYAKDNPDTYPSTLCGLEALSCEEYGTADGGKAYFRNPTGRTCEYRDATGNATAGWYIQSTSSATPNCPIRNQGNIPPAVPTGGFAGLCPAEQNGCGTFLDPLGTGESFATNSGMEIANAAGTAPQNWTSGSSLQEYVPRGDTKAVRLTLNSAGFFTQTVNLDANTYYVVSADVERNVAEINPVRFGLVGCKDALNTQVRLYSPDNSMISDNSGAYQEVAADRFVENSLQRISGRVYSGNAVTCQIFAGSTGTVGHWFDNLQVRVTTNTPVIRQSVDSTSCNGQVGDKLGCHLFNDTANTALTYDVDLSPLGFKPTDADATGGPATCADQPERCDSNIVLKVSRDRTCSQWLAPTTTIESTKPTGQKENLVLGVATCDRFSPSGQCNRFVDEKRCANNPKQTCVDDDDCGGAIGACKPFPLDGNTQAYSREDLRNKSGLVVAGLQFGRSCSQDSSKSCANDADCGAGNTCLLTQLIEGKFPFGIAPQTGNDGVAIPDNILNGNFDATPTIQSSGWELTSASGSDGSNVKIVTSETLQAGNTVAPVEVNPYAELTPSSGGSAFTTLRTSDAALSGRLSSDRTYMLSFSARYVQAPDLAVQDTTLSAGIATQASVSIVANNAWFGKVLPTTTMQRYVIGPLKLSDGICGIGNECATLAQGNIAGINHKSFDPNTGIVYFMLDDGNRTGLIIDDVSLLPTLNVDDPLPATAGLTGQPSGDAYVARTCRAYPNSSALVCSYADDTGKRFDGWQGYCLERDPQNPNSCLSWYPVDLLAGSRNIFGKVEMAGYSDKAPLYMCLRAKGNYNRSVAIGTTNYTTFTTAFVRAEEAVGAAGEQPGSPLLNQSFQYRRPMMTQMGSGANGGPGIGYGVTSLSSGGTALTPVDFVQAAVGQDHDIHKSEIEKIAVLFQYGESNTWIPSANQSCYNDDCPNRGAAYSGLTPDGLAYMILDENANGNCPRLTGDHWCATWRGIEEPDNSGRSNFLTFNVNFDTNGYVLEYGAYAYDSTYGGGFAAAVVYYLREQCTDLVRVVDTSGQNAAWSTNITSSGFALPNYKYKLSQEDKPYGSIAPPAQNFDTPTDWDGITAFTGNQMLEVKQNTATARAGSAYTCTGDCSGRQCFGLPATALGAANASYSCNTVADIQACTSAGGYCNGFGPAKLCVAGPRANPATPVACATNDECGINGRCDYAGRYCSVTTGGIAVGTACTTSTDCGTGGTCSTFTNISGGVYATRKLNNILAIDRLKLLFANVYTAWQWTPANGNGAYAETQSLIDDWQDDYQDMQLCNGTTLDRNAADFDPARAYCANLPSISNVAIGTQTAGDIVVSSGELLQLRFNTFVDSQQLPLKNIAIDWDGDNASDELLSWGFAPLSNPADPHSISHVYRYGYGMSNCFAAGTGPYATNASVGGKEYCVVQPQVQVQDNWEWCNGGRCLTSTPTAFPASSGSYWQQFGGDIIVVRR